MAIQQINKLPNLMPCPYHGCLPVYSKDVISKYLTFHYWFCPECNKVNPTPDKHNAFGHGYSSQHSKSAAKANWNNAVHRRQLTLLKKAIKSGQ